MLEQNIEEKVVPPSEGRGSKAEKKRKVNRAKKREQLGHWEAFLRPRGPKINKVEEGNKPKSPARQPLQSFSAFFFFQFHSTPRLLASDHGRRGPRGLAPARP